MYSVLQKVVVYAVRKLDHTADSYSDVSDYVYTEKGERLMFGGKKRNERVVYTLLEKQARVICKCNVD